MKSPYEKLNYFYLHDIPFLPLATRGNAVNCRIGLSRQLVFIPKKYFDVTIDDITLKEGIDLEWFYNKRDTQNKIKCYLKESGE
jgi:hypothetical protein